MKESKSFWEKALIVFMIATGLAFIVAALIDVFRPSASVKNMKRYVIPAGKHYRANLRRLLMRVTPLPWFWLKKRKLVAYIQLPESSLWPNWGDADLKWDWNKIIGFNLKVWRPAHEWSCLAAFRCPSEKSWQVTGYANKGSSHKRSIGEQDDNPFGDNALMVFLPKEVIRVQIIPVARNKAAFEVARMVDGKWEGRIAFYDYDMKISFAGLAGPWFGGQDGSDENDIGGTPPKDVEIFMSWSFERQ